MKNRIIELAKQAELCCNYSESEEKLLRFVELIINESIKNLENKKLILFNEADSDFDDGFLHGLNYAELLMKNFYLNELTS